MGFFRGARARLCRRSLIVVATCAASLAAAGAANAATLTVNSTTDEGNGPCTATMCTLRDAINDSSAGDTVVVPAGTYTLAQGELSIEHDLTISGAGASTVTVSGDNNSRVFFVDFNVTATISGMTITAGNSSGSSSGNDNGWDGTGGGILSFGSLAVNDSTVIGNAATSGNGGGIAAEFGALSIDGATISDNTISNYVIPNTIPLGEDGAGLHCVCTQMSVNNSTVSGNHSVGANGYEEGGGIYVWVNAYGPELRRPGSVPHALSAPHAVGTGIAKITNTTVSGNSVSYQGGGIYLTYGTLDLSNATISGNTAGQQGGGIYDYDTLNSANNTVANNSSPDGANVYANNTTPLGGFENTLVAEPKGGGQNCSAGGTSFPPSLGHNLEDDTAKSCGFTAVGDISGVSAVLGGLANNGGPTETMALLAGSPAIDHGATISSITTDQRGGPRPQPAGGAYDIGAYERGAVADMGIKKTAKPNPVRVGSHLTYTLTATNNGPSPDPAFDVTVVDKLPSSVKFVSDKPSQGKCGFSSGTLTCHLGTIDKGKSATVKLVVTPKKKGTVTNTATVSSSAKDPNTANNQATVKTRVKAAPKPVAVTGPATQVTSSSARLHGKVKPNGASTTYYFQYGTSTKYGSRTGSGGAGKGTTFRGVVRGVTGLKAGTLYHYRVVAHNANGTARGSDRTFRTPSVKPPFTG